MYSEKNRHSPVEPISFPEDPKVPRKVYISPLSRRQDADVFWEEINPMWQGYPDPESLSEIELEMIKDLNSLRFCTGIQLSREYLAKEKKGTKQKNLLQACKKRLKKLSQHGIIIRHLMKAGKKDAALYTLGPAGAKILDVPFTPNWWLDRTAYRVLRQLLSVHLFFRLKKLDPKTKYEATPQPFNGIIFFKDLYFLICIINGEGVHPELRWEKDKRIIMIAETLEEAEKTAKELKDMPGIRYTTDYDVLRIELYRALSKYDKKLGRLKPTKIASLTANSQVSQLL